MRRVQKQKLSTVTEVIGALGDRKKDAAAFMHVGPASVSIMLHEQAIPRAHHLAIYLYLTDQGYVIDTEAVFGYSLASLTEGNGQVTSTEMHAA